MTTTSDSSAPEPISENNLCSVIGESGIERLVAAFYRRVPDDNLLGPMYPAEDLAGAEERLRWFLMFRFGGPQTYLERRGHPALRMRHAPFPITAAARDRWIQLMTAAAEECQFSADVQIVLLRFLGQVAAFLQNQ